MSNPTSPVSLISSIDTPAGVDSLELRKPIIFKTLAHLTALLAPISTEIAALLAFAAETPDLAARLTALEANARAKRVPVLNSAARLALVAYDPATHPTGLRLLDLVPQACAAAALIPAVTEQTQSLAFIINDSAGGVIRVYKSAGVYSDLTVPGGDAAYGAGLFEAAATAAGFTTVYSGGANLSIINPAAGAAPMPTIPEGVASVSVGVLGVTGAAEVPAIVAGSGPGDGLYQVINTAVLGTDAAFLLLS
jgi:hypothetical protein